MTYKEFVAKMNELQDKKKEIERMQTDLQEKYKKEYKLQRGDKCIDEEGKICWFERLVFFTSVKEACITQVKYAKKDGTPSGNERYTWSKLTKLNE